ncbi:Retrovirus-related Pol polyprotein from transposon 17.6 [Dictyocoela muelleri]|nr:Retrovirus-related Pol polyprotein from transposon 17.6 [Dictyocoela muelleri]
MNSLFRNVKNTFVCLDDILVHSWTLEDHYQTLKQVFKIIGDNNISVNFEKSKFLQGEVIFLSHHIDENGIRPNISKIDNISLNDITTKKKLPKSAWNTFVPPFYIKYV